MTGDLIVSDVSHSPQPPTASTPVTIIIEVTNIGQSSAGPSTARVHISSDTVGVPPVHLPIPGLAPEQRFQTEFSVFLPAGDYTTFALADAFNAVNEENETNNQAQEQFTLLP